MLKRMYIWQCTDLVPKCAGFREHQTGPPRGLCSFDVHLCLVPPFGSHVPEERLSLHILSSRRLQAGRAQTCCGQVALAIKAT